jgi:hypothetical protein
VSSASGRGVYPIRQTSSIYRNLADKGKSASDVLLRCEKEADTKFQKLCIAALQQLKTTPPYERSSGEMVS